MDIIVTDRPLYPEEDLYSEGIEHLDAELQYGDFTTEDEVIEGCKDYDIIVTVKAPFTRRVLDELDKPSYLIRAGMGYDNVNIPAATDNDILVANTPFCAEEVADHTIALMFAAAHELVYYDQELRTGVGWGERGEINQLKDATFGMIGVGHVARAVVPKVKSLGMDIIAYDPYLSDDVFSLLDIERVTLSELLSASDCVSLHPQLTPETHHILSEPEFKQMKDTAIVVNTARGPMIDETALVEAVENSEISGAGLDVFEVEPPTSTPAFRSDKIVCSPHRAGLTSDSIKHRTEMVQENLRRIVQGDHPRNIINSETRTYGDELFSPELAEWESDG